ncbi:MAG: AtpZ/AtpI family protein [Actinobacteria bacterium]|nr:AtpZ/AtpI family protein [Actinomycetota bacterium]
MKPPKTTDRETPNVAWTVMNNLIAGILVYGGLGYLIGLWLGNAPVGLAIGTVFGLVASTFLISFRLRHLDGGPNTQREA